MSFLPADLVIWALLFIGIVFCGVGLMGLLIFPDTKSRMFTAFRATAIALGAVVLAVITYGYSLVIITEGDQYTALILRTLFLAFVLAAGTWVMYGIIRERTCQQKPKGSDKVPSEPDNGTKNGE